MLLNKQYPKNNSDSESLNSGFTLLLTNTGLSHA